MIHDDLHAKEFRGAFFSLSWLGKIEGGKQMTRIKERIGIIGIVAMAIGFAALGLTIYAYAVNADAGVTVKAEGYVLDAPDIPGQNYEVDGGILTITLE